MPLNFRELEEKMSPERIKRSNARVDEMIQAIEKFGDRVKTV